MKFDFDPGFQRALLRLCMIDEHFNHRVQSYVRPDYFTTEALGWIFKVFSEYHKQYSGLPCREVPLREYVRHSGSEAVAMEAETVIAMGHSVDSAFVKDRLQEFIQRNLFTKAFHDAQHVYNQGKFDNAIDLMRGAVDKIAEIDFDEPKRSFFFDELERRQLRRYRYSLDPLSGTYSTGMQELDQKLNGGIHEGEVFMMMSYPKVGKTTWLINQGFQAAYFSHVPVLHINLEGTLDEIEDKYEACFAQLIYYDVRQGAIDQAAYRHMLEEYRSLRGLLVIRSFDELDVTVQHIDKELSELKAVRGFVPKVMILDYIDLVRSRHRAQSENEHQTSATRDIKRLSTNRRIATWTGTQAKRPQTKDHLVKEHVLTSADVADSYGKIRIVDGYGSINMTQDEQKLDQWRVYWEGYRAARVGRLYRVTNDIAKMRIGLKVQEITTKGDRRRQQESSDEWEDVADAAQ